MGKPTGFIQWERLLVPRRPVEERTGDFHEIERMATPEHARQQAERRRDNDVKRQLCPAGECAPGKTRAQQLKPAEDRPAHILAKVDQHGGQRAEIGHGIDQQLVAPLEAEIARCQKDMTR